MVKGEKEERQLSTFEEKDKDKNIETYDDNDSTNVADHNNNNKENDGNDNDYFSKTILTSSPNSSRPYSTSFSSSSSQFEGKERGRQYGAGATPPYLFPPHSPAGMIIWALFTIYTAMVYIIDLFLWTGLILTVAFVLIEVPAAIMWDESFLLSDEQLVSDIIPHSEN
mmetsp:Transcript_1484/g.2119  ORF Transcript_1484/g.2119 Transcript_1484/m.2119 type:complete len:168 (-) Transcript_1484:512-1015(-)